MGSVTRYVFRETNADNEPDELDEERPGTIFLDFYRSDSVCGRDRGGLTVDVKILQHPTPDFGLFTWPSSLVLASYVFTHRDELRPPVRVVEIGAGTALPGLLAARLGCAVTLTDREGAPEVLANMRAAIALNGVEDRCSAAPLSWGAFPSSARPLAATPDAPVIVLGSDVLYSSEHFADVLATARLLMEGCPARSQFWTAYHERSSARSLLPALRRQWGLAARAAPLARFAPDACVDDARCASVRMLVFTLAPT